ncbi:MAG: hypothetical protein JWR08_1375 [Enterovirga sp.]|nr:hypothetical protein [Enterovirga sp.]
MRPKALIMAILATALVCGPALVAPAAAQGAPRSIHASSIPGRTVSYPAAYRMCDRAAVRSCQADARMDMQTCESFPGRLPCADRVLSELSMCWAATGCF